ncbi:uncharacterized protein LOC108033452 isoform X2 [Drosophila biarmipes]|uniref:uncharacterized protein LOC108033452 isoform X2 n=1 Tax=Drosophila biarmipes TaxID=125945 RepID=UPI0007E86B0F|nr:uncharacterized protein LOC108033452 isoform X2 [Drosophila biarmipes]
MPLYQRRLRASLLMAGLLMLAISLDAVHAKWGLNIFKGGKIASSVPALPIGWNVPMKPKVPLGTGAIQSLPGKGGSFSVRNFDSTGIGSHSLPSDAAWLSAWKISRKPLATPPTTFHFYEHSLTHNSDFKPVDTPKQSNKNQHTNSHTKEGDTSSSNDFDIDELISLIDSVDLDDSTGMNETLPAKTVPNSSTTQRSGMPVVTGLFDGALDGGILGPELKVGEDKNIRTLTATDLKLDESMIATEGTQKTDPFRMPVASSASARTTVHLTGLNELSKLVQFAYYAWFGPDNRNPAEHIFRNLSLISMGVTLLVFFCLN